MMGMAMAGAAVGDGSVVPMAAQIAQDAVRQQQQHHAQMQAQMQAASMRPASAPWSREEVNYAETLTNEFFAGRLPLPNGTTLLTFLATALNCDSQRVAQRFLRTALAARLQEPFVHKEHLPTAVQMELKILEGKFLEVTSAQQRGLSAPRAAPSDPPLSMHLPSGSGGSGPRFQNAAQKFRARSRSSDMLQRRGCCSRCRSLDRYTSYRVGVPSNLLLFCKKCTAYRVGHCLQASFLSAQDLSAQPRSLAVIGSANGFWGAAYRVGRLTSFCLF